MTTKTPAKRVDAIDFWRGFALLTIFIDHVPDNAFQHVTIRNFGFSDAAELFVFLSGASVALAYGTRFFNGETWAAVRAVFRRAFTLYWVQLLTSLLIIVLLAAAVSVSAHHSFSAEFDASKTVTLEGKVVMMEWVNPHSWLHIDVTNPDGSVDRWMRGSCFAARPRSAAEVARVEVELGESLLESSMRTSP